MVLAERRRFLLHTCRECDMLLIGKTYWKSVVQPRVLNVSLVVVWSRHEKAM